jgi:RNA polymerase sigma-70 factor (ECF subfamily)
MADSRAKGIAAALLPVGAEVAARAEVEPIAEPDLVAGALAGDRAAWQALIARHERKVIVSLLARGLPLDRAREVAQETWTRLMESQRAGRLTRVTLPGLAIVQAGYLVTSDWRRQPRELPAAPAIGAAADSPEDRAIDRQALSRVARALERCPARARRVFEAVYQNPELSYDELGARLGLSAQRVKQTVCEVRKRLRVVLGEEIP